ESSTNPKREREAPATDRQRQWPAPNAVEIDLDAGDEEEEAQPHLPEYLHGAVRSDPAEDLGADQNATQDFENDAGNAKPQRQLAEKRRQHGDQRDHEKRVRMRLHRPASLAKCSRTRESSGRPELSRVRLPVL